MPAFEKLRDSRFTAGQEMEIESELMIGSERDRGARQRCMPNTLGVSLQRAYSQ
jgi:hypothetical protein